jgi:poly-beta-hydroxybutyrate-responsive repressor
LTEFEPRNFLQACLLLLLCEKPDHGYELADRLRPMHDADGDAGVIYRTLRALERQSLVCSQWQRSLTGPHRRVYRVTEEGRAALDALTEGLRQTHAVVHVFLDRYTTLVGAEQVDRPGRGGRHTGTEGRHGGIRAPSDARGRSR